MNAVIKAENLGKKYIIGHQKQRGGATLRDAMTHTARGIWQRIRHPLSPNRESIDLEELWALKDVNFEVQQGERIGIIGRNGAGKSTLLKVLSRITEPTTGKVRIKGRVSSLLEVGTGFHPELTGRENVFLNGAILGMTRQEVKRKFDEIIAFAELEKFLDTPVKRYSSGMYVRLAFAVAAHLEPEILIVDEVLAVGDAAFQKKCLGKMENVAGEGRTVLLVSHNMVAIEHLCSRVLLLQEGGLLFAGDTFVAINAYLAQGADEHHGSVDLHEHPGRVACSNQPVFQRITLRNAAGVPSRFFRMGEDITFELEIDLGERELREALVRISVDNALGLRVCTLFSERTLERPINLRGKCKVRCQWQDCRLMPAGYTVKLALANRLHGMDTVDVIERAIDFQIEAVDLYGSGRIVSDRYSGVFAPNISWIIDGQVLN